MKLQSIALGCAALVVGTTVSGFFLPQPAQAGEAEAVSIGLGLLGVGLIDAFTQPETTTVIVQPPYQPPYATPVYQPIPQPPIYQSPYPPMSYVQQVLYRNGLTATACVPGTVTIWMTQTQPVCAYPTPYVPLGVYSVHPQSLQLISLSQPLF